MTDLEHQAILTIALMAAFAEGDHSDTERAELKRIANSLSQDGKINAAAIYQDVILHRASIDSAVAALTKPSDLCVSIRRKREKHR